MKAKHDAKGRGIDVKFDGTPVIGDAKYNSDVVACDLIGAVKPLFAACDTGHVKSCSDLASEYRLDPKKEAAYAARACDLGDGWRCSSLGSHLVHGRRGYPKNVSKGLSLLGRGCDGGHATSCYVLSQKLTAGVGDDIKPDIVKANAVDEQLCALPNNTPACLRVGKRYMKGVPGISRNDDKAARFFRFGCNNNRWAGALAGESCSLLSLLMLQKMQRNDPPITAEERLEGLNASFDACTLAGLSCDGAMKSARQRSYDSDKARCAKGHAEACRSVTETLAAKGCEFEQQPQCKWLGANAPSKLRSVCVSSGESSSPACVVLRAQGGDVPLFHPSIEKPKPKGR